MSNIHTLVDAIDVSVLLVPASRNAGTATTTTYIDMSGYQGGVALLSLGAISSTGTVDFKVVQATAAAGTGSKDLTGGALVQIADTGGSKVYAIEFRTSQLDMANSFFFVGVSLVTGTAANVADAVLIRHRGFTMRTSTSLTQRVKV